MMIQYNEVLENETGTITFTWLPDVEKLLIEIDGELVDNQRWISDLYEDIEQGFSFGSPRFKEVERVVKKYNGMYHFCVMLGIAKEKGWIK